MPVHCAALLAEPSDDRGLSAAAVHDAAIGCYPIRDGHAWCGHGYPRCGNATPACNDGLGPRMASQSAGVFPTKNGRPADDAIRHAVWRMEQTPGQWMVTTTPQEKPFAQPVGAIAWQAAFERLCQDATTPLPED